VASRASRPLLRELADRAGILARYTPAGSRRPRPISDATRVALLAALGYEASSEAAAARSLARLAEEERAGAQRGPAPPVRCPTPRELLGGRRLFGVWANLYSIRGRGPLGIGNLSDLRALVRLAAGWGAAFVGVSPLHAVRARGGEHSPYGPQSRLFRNPLYLDVLAVPELAAAPAAQALLASPGFERERALLGAAERLDYERAARLQQRLLRALWRAFAGREDTPRARALEAFRRREGAALLDFATFCALEEHLAGRGQRRDWRAWPARWRRPDAPAVLEFRRHHPREVGLHAFVQFELDTQLAASAREARACGLALGLYPDLAVGSLGSGFDAWAFPDLHVAGVHLGAPPDAYAPEGQDWGLPPLHPRRLAREGLAFWRACLRAGFQHAGALRIDHVLGLFRQWWVPAGRAASEGAYVRFPTGALLRVLAEESRRARALAVGEDLGTVPSQTAPTLARAGVLSSRVLLFERTRSGGFRPARRYSRRALVTTNTHDLPPLAGWWQGRDLELRRELGLFHDPAALARARRERAAARAALLRRLRSEGQLPPAAGAPSPPELARAVHAFLCATPCPLVGLSLDDLTGESEPINLPGVPADRYPSWTRRMRLSLEELAGEPGVRVALEGARERRRRRPVRHDLA
jgi:4-alpha-glucanotransferase